MGQYNGNAADPAGGKMIGEFEKVYAYGDQQLSLIHILRDGHILQIGDPKRIYDEPVNAVVADFIGESNICLLYTSRCV